MTNSQKIHIRIEELRKKASELHKTGFEDAEFNQRHQSLQDQILGLEMALEIIERSTD
ncbi:MULTISPECIES: hypothetical protein [unclassified Leeuwenhoekiella]|uniref:hypothetical protein n=1 Tax=unclassified Leeuwenhoekiella TaxID=2615029 RepID=UPI0025C22F45|nr:MULTISPECIES: hypothetical protein [unclassified Leeuwenhoekiella]|tara:strand:- start:2834 stop:3007 length:174 start_codon:yes stop_codon:yes gene_type:complete